jgi:DNA-binding FrmR family transcriptional regulator
MKKILHRLHRLQGQLHTIEDRLQTGADCTEIIPQLLATKGALDGLVREYMQLSLDACAESKDKETMKQIIKLFIKNS